MVVELAEGLVEVELVLVCGVIGASESDGSAVVDAPFRLICGLLLCLVMEGVVTELLVPLVSIGGVRLDEAPLDSQGFAGDSEAMSDMLGWNMR